MKNKQITFHPLSRHKLYAPILAHWSYQEWYKERDISFDVMALDYIKRAQDDTVPCSIIAMAGTFPVGMATLKENDLWSRKDLYPWLASLYVLPEYRNRGIASKLIDLVLKNASDYNYEKIYLFLGQKEQNRLLQFYLKKDWKHFDDAIDNDGRPTKILFHEL